jgi:hypothetical protein
MPRGDAGEIGNEPDRRDPEPARGAARCCPEHHRAVDRLLEIRDDGVDALHDSRCQRRRMLPSRQQAPVGYRYRDALGPRAPDVDEERGLLVAQSTTRQPRLIEKMSSTIV